MAISQYIKEIGRGPRGSKPLTREQAADLFGQVLDGSVTDLEIGAFCLAMRIKGETPEEMCGFLDATHQRLARLPATSRPTIVLPSYNGARKLPVLTPLLAMLLAREGLPVLLHGMRTEARRILASDVLEALDIKALAAPKTIANGQVAHIHTHHLHPGLARLLSVRQVVGLRNPGHSVVKLMNPCAGPAVVVTAYTHPARPVMTHSWAASTSYWKSSNREPLPKWPACPPKSMWPPPLTTPVRCYLAPCRCPPPWHGRWNISCNLQLKFLERHPHEQPYLSPLRPCPPPFGHGRTMHLGGRWAR